MDTTIHRTLKDLRYLVTAETWESNKSIVHIAPENRFERLEKHGWIENRHDGWMEDHPNPEKRRATPVVIANLTEEGRDLRNQFSLSDIRDADNLSDLIQTV